MLSSGLVTPASPLICIALAHGFAIAALVFASIGISGGRINPVVSMAFILCRSLEVLKGILYICAQFAGGIVGAFLLKVPCRGLY